MNSLPEITEEGNNNIQLDTAQIDKSINEKGEFGEKGKIYFKYFNNTMNTNHIESKENNDTDGQNMNKYLADIHARFHYIGVLSANLTKEKFGKNTYPHGDLYLGEWKNDKKHGIGLYEYSDESRSKHEIYVGNWENGSKKGNGIYYWINNNVSSLDGQLKNIPIDVAIGSFEKDNFVYGITYQQIIDENSHIKQMIYLGKYNEGKKKEDLNAMLIQNNELFIGEIKDDQIIKGKIITFNQEEPMEIQRAYFFDETKGDDKEKFITIDLTHEDKEENIEKKKKYDLMKLFENIEKYYMKIYLCSKNDNFDAFGIENMERVIQLLQDHLIINI